jgi:hypothetical protein
MRRYWKLKEEALDHTLRRTWFGGRGYGPVVIDYVMMTKQAYGNTAMCCSTNRFTSIIDPV